MVKRLRDTRDGTVYGWNRNMEAEAYMEPFDDETDKVLEKESEQARRREEDRRVAADPDQHPDIMRNALANTNVPPDPGRNYEHQVGAAALGLGEGHGDYPETEENIVPHQKVFTVVAPTDAASVDNPEVPNQRVKTAVLDVASEVKENPATDPEQGGGDHPVGTEPPQPEKPANIVLPKEGEEVPNQGVRLMIQPDPKNPTAPEEQPMPEPDEGGADEEGGEEQPAPAPAPAKRATRRRAATK